MGETWPGKAGVISKLKKNSFSFLLTLKAVDFFQHSKCLNIHLMVQKQNRNIKKNFNIHGHENAVSPNSYVHTDKRQLSLHSSSPTRPTSRRPRRGR